MFHVRQYFLQLFAAPGPLTGLYDTVPPLPHPFHSLNEVESGGIVVIQLGLRCSGFPVFWARKTKAQRTNGKQVRGTLRRTDTQTDAGVIRFRRCCLVRKAIANCISSSGGGVRHTRTWWGGYFQPPFPLPLFNHRRVLNRVALTRKKIIPVTLLFLLARN